MEISEHKDRLEINDKNLLQGIEIYAENTKNAGEKEIEFMNDLLILKEGSNMLYSALVDVEQNTRPVNEVDLKMLLLNIDEFLKLSEKQLEGI